jgi:hypothetical protein
MGTYTILTTASALLWCEVAADGLRALVAVTKEQPASFLAYLLWALFEGYLAASLWGMA